MKKIAWSITSMILAAAFAISGCKKDDDNQASIVGTWEARKDWEQRYDLSKNPPVDLYHMDTTYAPGEGYTYEFRSDNSFVALSNYRGTIEKDSGTYTLTNNRVLTLMHVNELPVIVNADITADQLTMSVSDTVNHQSRTGRFTLARIH